MQKVKRIYFIKFKNEIIELGNQDFYQNFNYQMNDNSNQLIRIKFENDNNEVCDRYYLKRDFEYLEIRYRNVSE